MLDRFDMLDDIGTIIDGGDEASQLDKGCGSVLIVFILTLCGWVPGVIAALVILNNSESQLK